MRADVRLGLLRLTDAAPVVFAQVHGLFAAEGLDVSISVESSWANIADKLAWGALDGAVMLPPLVFAMLLGLRGPATPLAVPAGISLNGNAITLSGTLAAPILEAGRPRVDEAASRLAWAATGRPPLRLAVVHAFSTHDLLLRLFLERGGIEPHQVEIVVIPPPDMPAALAAGEIDGFCAGAPWGVVAAERGAGQTVALSSDLVPNHPEKCLALRAGWAAAHPGTVASLLRALHQAGEACDRPESTPALAALLARPEWVGVPAPMIAASLPGGGGGGGGEVDRSTFAAHGAMDARPEDARWFIRQMARWRDLPAGAEAAALASYQPHLVQTAR